MRLDDKEELLEKYLQGKCTPEEAALIEAAYELFIEQNPVDPSFETLDDMEANTWRRISDRTRSPRKLYPYIYAAALLLALGVSLYFFNYRQIGQEQNHLGQVLQDIAPGGNKAVLILADGRQVEVGDASGSISTQGGSIVSQSNDSTLVYIPTDGKPKSDKALYNTLVTPRGGQFSIQLPDGSRVWLNAASELKYPADFTGMQDRRVELSGEAYFEVAKDHKRPFIVVTPTQQVTVLGTHFNINSYRDEKAIVTTLLEGSVSILTPNSSPKILIPGQQAKEHEGKMEILPADRNATAWKDGKISLDGDLQRIMRQVSRWYDVEVSYEGNIPHKEFSGAIFRNTSLAQLLDILKMSGKLNFKIEQDGTGKKILTVKNSN